MTRMTGGRTDREIIVDYCAKGNIAGLVDAQRHLGNFPKGGDGTFGNRWISYAIVSGNPAAVTWMINEGADLNFRGTMAIPSLMTVLSWRVRPVTKSFPF
ncbi:hypothetical protein [Sulfitobacter aestuariivivens]|uniref:hypothetical protein n=1 Tax=Sulfitobacter aestuariivivens TaxID=2766981 RepID=UPI003622263C